MKQADFTDDAYKLARTSDPETSKEAAAAIVEELPGLRRETLEAIRENPDLTVTELAKLKGLWDPRRYGRRTSELEKLGLVYVADVRKCKVTGRTAQTWRVREEPNA